MDGVYIDNIKVNEKRITENSFLNDLSLILKEHFNQLEPESVGTFKELYLMVEPYLEELRKKYNLDENPTGTNSILVSYRSGFEAAAYTKEYMYIKDDYNKFIAELDKLFKINSKYTTAEGYTYYFDRIPSKAITNFKSDIIKEYDLNNKDKHQPHILQHILTEVRRRFE